MTLSVLAMGGMSHGAEDAFRGCCRKKSINTIWVTASTSMLGKSEKVVCHIFPERAGSIKTSGKL